ncbi:hypothetical protein ACOXXX_13645 [Thalassococcus sp. BH17M4-6]|uniref:hypothetical protein n=1 Tax=Thalassococcus sp. BH17M4-6 TaxID=3413148 RepID=UPI003BD9BE7F
MSVSGRDTPKARVGYTDPKFAARLARMGLKPGHDLSHETPRLRRSRSKPVAVIVLVLLLGAVLWVDHALFQARADLRGQGRDLVAYVTDRLGLSVQPTRHAPFPDRDYRADPLSLVEKAAFSRHLPSALPPAPPGWTLRPFESGDQAILRPELAHCGGGPVRLDADYFYNRTDRPQARCPAYRNWTGVWVYAQANKRIAIGLHYKPSRSLIGRVCMPRGPVPSVFIEAFGADYASRAYRSATFINGWRFGALPSSERRPGHVRTRMPLRMLARKAGDGALTVFAMANAARSDVTRILGGLDTDAMTALIAPG